MPSTCLTLLYITFSISRMLSLKQSNINRKFISISYEIVDVWRYLNRLDTMIIDLRCTPAVYCTYDIDNKPENIYCTKAGSILLFKKNLINENV